MIHTLLEYVENPEALAVLSSVPLSLESVTISRLSFDYNGPTATLSLQIDATAADLPDRWVRGAKCNAVTLELQAIGMRENRVSGWSTENVATISLHRADEGSIHLRAQGSGLEMLMTFGWLRVKGILPYRKAVGSE